ncbi:flagellar biosynthesis protein FlhF [Kushneria sinocarnis]|uniref:Flagellar biosynthesis protein FlhF n=1 Tax=Kushneria sinocarnis TaxID=595502 RepID=A0A420X0Z8_9GAMM|nr:flagellar biosynthesis protein FlhF [Kushneria sinocarnis]RKR07521.1 flagellar biosynthesis protein FlhF [Kushneria sinocarnis]
MGVQRFIGINGRDAMRQVREAMGDDALILSNRPVEGGVEIIAMPEQEHEQSLAQFDSPDSASESTAPAPAVERAAATDEVSTAGDATQTPAPVTPGDDAALGMMQAMNRQLLDEMRSMLREQGSPAKATGADARQRLSGALRRRLLNAGFSATLVGELLEGVPEELLAPPADEADEAATAPLMAWLVRQLGERLSVLGDEGELFDDTGVFALVGPTGAGKTTTTAKLASRYVMRHGPKEAALVTTDSYRIGAAEQLRIYARLLGVEVHALDAEGDLGALLERLVQPRRALLSRSGGKRMMVIDTVGMSQRDQRLMGEIARLGDSPVPTRRLLVLDAARHGDTLEQIIEAWQQASTRAGAPLWGCILTKLDEAVRLGSVLDVVIRHRLRLCYVSRGQRVPEDIEPIDVQALLHEALSLDQASPFAFDEADLAAHPQESRQRSLSRDVLRQGSALEATFATLRSYNLGMTLLEQGWRQADQDSAGGGASGFARLMAATTQQTMLASSGMAHALWWSKETPVSGADQVMPLVTLDQHGLPQPLVWPRHRLPVGAAEQLAWAEQLGAQWQLLMQLPGIGELDRLDGRGCAWLAPVSGSRRVLHGGVRQPLSQLTSSGDELEPVVVRHQGRRVTLQLSRLDVTLTQRREEAHGLPVTAWYGELRDPDDGRRLAKRYWLGTSRAGRDAVTRIKCSLTLEQLPVLTRQAWQALEARGMARTDREQRWQLAAALAALALRLAVEEAEWAMDVRARLSRVAQRRCGRRPKALLEGLLDALNAREALSRAGAMQPVTAADPA